MGTLGVLYTYKVREVNGNPRGVIRNPFLYMRYWKCMVILGGHIYEVVIISDPN